MGSESSASTGNDRYTPILRFDWNVLSHNAPDSIETLPGFDHSQLLNIIEHYPEFKTEQILKMTIYKHILEDNWQNKIPLAEGFRFHAFIVFTTKDWFYSIEKYGQRVSFQRARELRGKKNIRRKK
jgi:hypothetical protein